MGILGITAAGMRAVVMAGAEVTAAAAAVGIETQTLVPVDLFRVHFFRFIPV